MIKRLMDIAISLTVLMLMSPVMLLTAVLVRWCLGSPVLFRHQRPGLNGRPFILYKFRTMREISDSNGVPLPDDQRLTRLGAGLRRLSLDELPQLLNVLKGDMSLVGPRPLLMEYLPLYNTEQARRQQVKPGITGWAQVHGRNATTWAQRLHMDVWYVDHQSMRLDLRILARTVLRVIQGDGLSHPGHATMPKFTGNDT